MKPKIKSIVHEGKTYTILDSNDVRKIIMEDFKKNILNGLNKYPALEVTLSKLPNRCYFVSNSVSKKDMKKFLKDEYSEQGDKKWKK